MARMAFLALTVMLVACSSVSSVDTAIPRGAAVEDPRLAGTWAGLDGDGDSMHLVVRRVEPNRYEMVNVLDQPSDTVSVRFARLGEQLLMEASAPPARITTYDGWALPLYFQAVIELEDSAIRLAWFDPDSLGAALRKSDPQLEFIDRDGDLLLTSKTDRLARGLAAYARQPGILSKWTTWRRVTHGTGR